MRNQRRQAFPQLPQRATRVVQIVEMMIEKMRKIHQGLVEIFTHASDRRPVQERKTGRIVVG